jgi:hypothetical protein
MNPERLARLLGMIIFISLFTYLFKQAFDWNWYQCFLAAYTYDWVQDKILNIR